MSKKILISFLAVVLIGTGAYFVFFNKKLPANARLIPANASIVVSVNLMQLGQKAELQKIRKMNFAQNLMKELGQDNDDIKTLIDKAIEVPEITGIDFTKDVYFFMDASEKERTQSAGLAIKLTEKESFERLLKKFIPAHDFKIKLKNNYCYLSPDPRTTIAWNNDIALLFGGNRADLNNELDILMSDGPDAERLISNKKFTDFAINTSDIGCFMDGSKFLGLMKSMPEFSQMDGSPYGSVLRNEIEMLKGLYDGMYINFFVNFKNDKVDLTSKLIFDDPKKQSAYASFYGQTIDPDMVNYLAPVSAIAVAAGKIDIKKILSFYSGINGFDKVLQMLAEKTGIPADKLKTFFTGDVSLALTDVKPMTVRHRNFDPEMIQTYMRMYSDSIARSHMAQPGQMPNRPPTPPPPMPGQHHMPMMPPGPPGPPQLQGLSITTSKELMPSFTATIGISDKSLLDSLLLKFAHKEKGYYTFLTPAGYMFYFVPDKPGITITNDSEAAMILVNNGAFKANLRPEITNLIKDNTMGFYLDLQPADLPEKTRNNIKDKIGEADYKRGVEILSPFKNVTADYKGTESEFELNMAKTDHNSLFTIINHIDAETNK